MWVLLGAIVSASLLGSLHCVGMCGPLAIWASGAGDRIPTAQMTLATALYHFGRLITYALVGGIAGAVGQLTDWGGETLGVQLLAARVVGVAMIGYGSLRLIQMMATRQAGAAAAYVGTPQATGITRVLLALRPFVFRLPIPARGLATGLLTALLPCGWLYLFALVAAGTGSLTMGPIVMLAFWLGTVPALVGLVSGTQLLAVRFRKLIPAGAALLLIVGGCYTAAGRGFAQLNSLADIRITGSTHFPAAVHETSSSASGAKDRTAQHDIAEGLAELAKTPLPCCTPLAAPPTPIESAP